MKYGNTGMGLKSINLDGFSVDPKTGDAYSNINDELALALYPGSLKAELDRSRIPHVMKTKDMEIDGKSSKVILVQCPPPGSGSSKIHNYVFFAERDADGKTGLLKYANPDTDAGLRIISNAVEGDLPLWTQF